MTSQLRTGMGFTTLDSLRGRPNQVGTIRIWDIGATWKDIHTGPDQYDWAKLDEIVAASAGERIIYCIAATPRWAAENPDAPHYAPWLGPGSNSLPGDVNASWKPFVSNIAQRYKNRIHGYEIWNEPQLPDFMYPWNSDTRKRLAKMTNDAARIIREFDPKAEVYSASVLPRSSSGGMEKGSKYLSALKTNGVKLDGYTCHLYPFVGDQDFGKMLSSVRECLPNKARLLVTECAIDLLGPETTSRTRIDAGVKDLYSAMRNDEEVIWYAWQRPDLGGALLDSTSSLWESILQR